MSVRTGRRGVIPNWIGENDWSPESRIEWAGIIMSHSPRDWSYEIGGPGRPEPELWALWCIIKCDTKEKALELWWGFCDGWNAKTSGKLKKLEIASPAEVCKELGAHFKHFFSDIDDVVAYIDNIRYSEEE